MFDETIIESKLKSLMRFQFGLKVEKKDFKMPRVLPLNFRSYLTKIRRASQIISFVISINRVYFIGIQFITYEKAYSSANAYLCLFFDNKSNYFYEVSFYRIFDRKLNEKQIINFFINEFDFYFKKFFENILGSIEKEKTF